MECILIIGPMFAGKTSELMRITERYELAGRKVTYIKPDIDNRYAKNAIATHSGKQIRCQPCPVDFFEDIEGMRDFVDTVVEDALAIDEAQFLKGLTGLVKYTLSAGKTIVISALNGDFNQRPMGEISNIIPYATDIRLLSAIDREIGDLAFYTVKISGNPTSVIEVGNDIYRAYGVMHMIKEGRFIK